MGTHREIVGDGLSDAQAGRPVPGRATRDLTGTVHRDMNGRGDQAVRVRGDQPQRVDDPLGLQGVGLGDQHDGIDQHRSPQDGAHIAEGARAELAEGVMAVAVPDVVRGLSASRPPHHGDHIGQGRGQIVHGRTLGLVAVPQAGDDDGLPRCGGQCHDPDSFRMPALTDRREARRRWPRRPLRRD
ncbi:hypothetical protein SDC9_177422 [bioreactor metagenome]|uniref:Uncharacterized protein n=1 Tax=bioreactor metagenome TaxID=1076179 RepID=A0A645GT75_9ZZZZ